MTRPAAASLSSIRAHCSAPIAAGSTWVASERQTPPSVRMIELRTVAGIVSREKIGTSTNAKAKRAEASATSSSWLAHPRRRHPSAQHPREVGEDRVGEGVEAAREQPRGDEQRDHHREELQRILQCLLLQLVAACTIATSRPTADAAMIGGAESSSTSHNASVVTETMSLFNGWPR
ncbi:hypothetical protein DdX_21861 [Ditylenchus destructor]|uniref:Uncharacterized protein n=1 Tax=Ditylenchus destructor TaxID=166010 RepID=A0AAD4MEB5_9BILA|nr:hypothetical protein DdX_21861 [Ditylenchus destructor]